MPYVENDKEIFLKPYIQAENKKRNIKKKIDPYKPLNKYEEGLKKALDNDEFVPVPNQEKEIARYTRYARAMLKKTSGLPYELMKKIWSTFKPKLSRQVFPTKP